MFAQILKAVMIAVIPIIIEELMKKK